MVHHHGSSDRRRKRRGLPYVLTREQALAARVCAHGRCARRMERVELSRSPGKLVHEMVLKAKPQVRLLELRLPGGGVRGGREPLGLLVCGEQRATPSTYPINADGSGRMKYDRESLSATLKRDSRASHADLHT